MTEANDQRMLIGGVTDDLGLFPFVRTMLTTGLTMPSPQFLLIMS